MRTGEGGVHLPFSPQVFWLVGSLLIIGLASVVVPTIGWRWLIRIASIPGIVLILAFKVRMLMGLYPPVLPSCGLFSHVHLVPLSICLKQLVWKGHVGEANVGGLS